MKKLTISSIIFLMLICSCKLSNNDLLNYNKGYNDALMICNQSNNIKIDSLNLACDSLKNIYNDEIITVRLAKLQAIKYAKIVQKNPTQSPFIVNWITRSFDGTIPIKVK